MRPLQDSIEGTQSMGPSASPVHGILCDKVYTNINGYYDNWPSNNRVLWVDNGLSWLYKKEDIVGNEVAMLPGVFLTSYNSEESVTKQK